MTQYQKGEFVGIYPSSIARKYKFKEYSSTEIRKGKEVHYYECFTSKRVESFDNEELDKLLVKRIENAFNIKFDTWAFHKMAKLAV